jgi:hypothetical protein
MAAGRPLRVIVIYSEFRQDDKAETIKRGGVYVSKMAGIEKMVRTIRGILSA